MDSWVKLSEFRSLFHHLLSCRRIALGVLILKIRLIIVPHRHVKKLKKGNTHKEKAMAPHSSTLAWKIPWTEEPGRLQSMGSLRVRHNWATSLSLFTFMHWRRKWQPTPVFFPGESQGWGSLVGCRLWGRRVGHDWVTSLSLFTFPYWRRKWQPTPVFFPGESQGWRSLVGCRLWGHKESDTTEVT